MTNKRWAQTVVLGVAVAIGAAAIGLWPGSPGWGGAARRTSLHTMSIDWPMDGQSALAISGVGHGASRPRTQPAPIASVAKVMTAYVVLQHFPLTADEGGFTLTLSDDDARTSLEDAAQGQSYVPVAAGEALTERQALEALLLPSANNIAGALAVHVAGSESAFVNAMNTEARALGMRHTTYTDPSGLDPSTVSTASDQLRLARAALRNPTLAGIMGEQSAQIPVAGTITSTNSLLGQNGFVAGKTGSDDAAGGCFMFKAVRNEGGRRTTIIGVVLGQRHGPFIQAGLSAANELVDSLSTRLE